MNESKYRTLSSEGQTIVWYKERNQQLAELVRELAGEKATRLMAKKFDVSTQAVNLLYPIRKEQS